MALVGGVLYNFAEKLLEDSIKTSLQYHANFRTEQIVALYEKQRDELEAVVENSVLKGVASRIVHIYINIGSDNRSYRGYQQRLRSQYDSNREDSEELFILSPNGTLIFSLKQSSDDDLGVDLTADGVYGKTIFSDAINRVLSQEDTVVSNYGWVDILNRSTALIVTPLFEEESILGERDIVALIVRPFDIKELRTTIHNGSELGSSGAVVVAQWQSDKESLGFNFITRFKDSTPPSQSCLEQRRDNPYTFTSTMSVTEESGEGWLFDYNCTPVYAVWSWISELRWGIVVKQDRDEIMGPVKMLQHQILTTLFILFFIFMLMMRYLSNGLLQPIRSLIEATSTGKVADYPQSKVIEVNQLAAAQQRQLKQIHNHEIELESKIADRTEKLRAQAKVQDEQMENLTKLHHKITHERNFADSVLSSMQEGVVVLDKNGDIVRCNSKLLGLLGYSDDQLNGRALNEFFVEDSTDSNKYHYDTPSSEQELISSNDERIPVKVSGALLKSEHKEQQDGAVLVIHDLRHQKMLERSAQESAYHGGMAEISSQILHNFGNALHGIKYYLDNLETLDKFSEEMVKILRGESEKKFSRAELADASEEAAKKYLKDELTTIKLTAEHMAEILSAQQGMVRNGGNYWISEFNLAAAMEEAMTLIKDRADRSQIKIKLSFSGDIANVKLPRNPLQQMIINMVKNSIDAIDEIYQLEELERGEGIVEISIKQIDTNNFSITCRDNGMGFENSDSVKMFSSSYTTKEHGTGQGLHSIANFINSLNGSLNFVSEGRLQGSSFTATVPLRAEIEPATYQLTTN